MLVDTNQTINVTDLQKQLPKAIREINSKKTKLFISRRNKISAVMLSPEEYERLTEIAELLEHLEIAEHIQKRMKNYDPRNNILWKDIKAMYGL